MATINGTLSAKTSMMTDQGAQREDLDDDRPGEPLADQTAESAGHLVQEHDAGHRPQGEEERGDQLRQYVTMQESHGLTH